MNNTDNSFDTVGDVFRHLTKCKQERRRSNLRAANPEGWIKHTEYHWSRSVNGKRLDYWPSSKKFRYEGRTMCSNVEGFIKNKVKNE